MHFNRSQNLIAVLLLNELVMVTKEGSFAYKSFKERSPAKSKSSHFREHKFKHSFQDSFNPFCSCRKGEVETSSHYLLYCSNYSEERLALLNTIKNNSNSFKSYGILKFWQKYLISSQHPPLWITPLYLFLSISSSTGEKWPKIGT